MPVPAEQGSTNLGNHGDSEALEGSSSCFWHQCVFLLITQLPALILLLWTSAVVEPCNRCVLSIPQDNLHMMVLLILDYNNG